MEILAKTTWRKVKLGDVVDVKGGKRLPKGEQLQSTKNFHPYIRITDIVNNQIQKNALQYVPDTIFPSIKSYIVSEGDIILSIVGTIGSISRIDKELHNASLTENCVKLTNFQSIDSGFLFYYLVSREGQAEILSRNVGSTQPKLPIYNIERIQILCPPLPEQRAIAAVLLSLDDKIELLHQQNKTLEAAAQAIFKEWFVKFNFPGATGKMVDSELGEIPERWAVGKLGDEVETVLGGTPNTEKKEYWHNGTIPWINSGKVNNFRIYKPTAYITEKALEESAAKLMPKGTVVIAITGATLGQVSRLEIDSTGNQSVIGILPNEKFPSVYLYYWVLENILNIISIATGGAQQHINKNDVNNFDFVIPENGILEKYFETANPMIEKISSNCFQIQTLSTLRDSLLPKLMSGEIKVSN